MSHDYIHLGQQGEAVGWDIRFYNATESTIDCNNRTVLLVEVEAEGCSFCDGSYAQHLSGVNIEGYVIRWQYCRNTAGRPVTEIEPIRDRAEQKAIVQALKGQYTLAQINFC